MPIYNNTWNQVKVAIGGTAADKVYSAGAVKYARVFVTNYTTSWVTSRVTTRDTTTVWHTQWQTWRYTSKTTTYSTAVLISSHETSKYVLFPQIHITYYNTETYSYRTTSRTTANVETWFYTLPRYTNRVTSTAYTTTWTTSRATSRTTSY